MIALMSSEKQYYTPWNSQGPLPHLLALYSAWFSVAQIRSETWTYSARPPGIMHLRRKYGEGGAVGLCASMPITLWESEQTPVNTDIRLQPLPLPEQVLGSLPRTLSLALLPHLNLQDCGSTTSLLARTEGLACKPVVIAFCGDMSTSHLSFLPALITTNSAGSQRLPWEALLQGSAKLTLTSHPATLLDCGLYEGRINVWSILMSSQCLSYLAGSVSGFGIQTASPRKGR